MERSQKLAEMIVGIIFLGIMLLIQNYIFTMESIIVLSNTKQSLIIERAELMARSVRASSPGVCRLERHMSEPRPIRHLYQHSLLCSVSLSILVLFYSSYAKVIGPWRVVKKRNQKLAIPLFQNLRYSTFYN